MSAAPDNHAPAPAAADAAVLDAIAWRLACSADWSADELTDIADLIGTVRPHPALLDPDADAELRAVQLDRYQRSLTRPTERNPT